MWGQYRHSLTPQENGFSPRLTSPSAVSSSHFLPSLPPLMVLEPSEGLHPGPVCISRPGTDPAEE